MFSSLHFHPVVYKSNTAVIPCKTLPCFSSCDLGLSDVVGAADRTASFDGSITANFYFLS